MLEVGYPERRIVFTKKQYDDFVSKWNGVRNVYRSVYSFNKTKNGEADYNTSKINQVFLDFDNENAYEVIKELVKQLKNDNLKFRVNFSGCGFHVYIVSEHRNIDRKQYLNGLHEYLINKYHLENSLDFHVKGDIKRIRRIEGTLNLKSNLYCIPLKEEEIFLSLNEIKEFAKRPRDFKVFWIDGKELSVDIDIKNNINENVNIENGNGKFKEIDNIAPEPCMARILNIRHPSQDERFLLCEWLSYHFRGGKDINDFNLDELCEKIISFMRGLNWDDYSEALNTSKSTRYQVYDIIPKRYNFPSGCKWRRNKGICNSEECWNEKYGFSY